MKTIGYLISTVISVVIATNQCENKNSELGFKLVRYAYSSTVVSEYPKCLEMCLDDVKCRSLNYELLSGKCEFNNASKVGVGLNDFLEIPDTIFSDIIGRETKFPSCKALRNSAQPVPIDGEYVIYPAGNPVKVYCDMTTDGGRSKDNMPRESHVKVTEMLVSPHRGGWTLVKKLDRTTGFPQPEIIGTYSDDYQILSDYKNALLFLSPTGLKKLREDMGFDEIRFFCYKVNVGKVIHIKTNKEALGEAVVNFFTVNPVEIVDNFPTACGSFVIMPDDTSEFSRRCNEWGLPRINPRKWGHASFKAEKRIYFYPGLVLYQYEFSFNRLLCDDNWDRDRSPTANGDEYQIFVR